ncbi:DegT/DnrJ/EryC1/StrS family aminotransferase [bacterium]|nr:DegT/DnrJ/EryC1/StrS family aminotransferase [bacterium]
MMKIPLVNLKGQTLEIIEDVINDIRSLALNGQFVGGDHRVNFERDFASFSHSDYCVGVANGTDALELTLKAFNLSPGDEVIIPANSFFASYEAVVNTGLVPVLVDINESDYLIDVKEVKKAITNKTRVVMGVNLYGNCCDLGALREIADAHNLYLVVDCAQGHGGFHKKEPLTKYAHCVTYSFYPGKNLGAWGDAGAVCTNDPLIHDCVKSLSNHGRLTEKYQHHLIGVNSRLDNIQAAVLNQKLKHLEKWTDARQQSAQLYNSSLSKHKNLILPINHSDRAEHVYHLYVVRLINIDRNELFEYLQNAGISPGLHYPIPINLQPGYIKTGFDFFPVSEQLASEIISLPLCSHITKNEIEFVCGQINSFLSHN